MSSKCTKNKTNLECCKVYKNIVVSLNSYFITLNKVHSADTYKWNTYEHVAVCILATINSTQVLCSSDRASLDQVNNKTN